MSLVVDLFLFPTFWWRYVVNWALWQELFDANAQAKSIGILGSRSRNFHCFARDFTMLSDSEVYNNDNSKHRCKSRKSSAVWTHFKLISDEKAVICLYCKRKLSVSGSTTPMHIHLRRRHPFLFPLAASCKKQVSLFFLCNFKVLPINASIWLKCFLLIHFSLIIHEMSRNSRSGNLKKRQMVPENTPASFWDHEWRSCIGDWMRKRHWPQRHLRYPTNNPLCVYVDISKSNWWLFAYM